MWRALGTTAARAVDAPSSQNASAPTPAAPAPAPARAFLPRFQMPSLFSSTPAECCGIVGVVGRPTDDARGYLMEGLQVMQNRGYDSAGIATVAGSADAPIVTTKYASQGTTADSIDLLRSASETRHVDHHIGIAHTRWATHGGKTDENAHPHCDTKRRIALVHNGTITNSQALRAELTGMGYEFLSATDTEVIAIMIGRYLDEGATSAKEATRMALERCDGTWGIAVLDKSKPGELVVACNGSPMVIGIGQGQTFIASETTAFNRHTKNFIAMQDGEIGVISAAGTDLDMARAELAPDVKVLLSPAPFPHWTLRECLEQPESIARALGFGGRLSDEKVFLGGFDRQPERMDAIQHLLIGACGTSLHAAQYGAKLMRELQSFKSVRSVDAAEIGPRDIPDAASGAFLAVSQSGETKDVHRALMDAERSGITCMSVVNSVGSLIARTTRLGVYLNAGRENAVASTKAFTTQVTVLALVACWFRQLREERLGLAPLPAKNDLMEALLRLPISFGMATARLREDCKRVAAEIVDAEHLFILGKGLAEPIAYEGALKIKECAYVHAEGYSGGALKHGPFALIEDVPGKRATPIVCIILDDEHARLMKTVAHEVKARNAQLIVITDNPKLAEGLDERPIVIPRNGMLTALIAVVPFQLIAYELALLKGVNPDFPRHLAKAVTVD